MGVKHAMGVPDQLLNETNSTSFENFTKPIFNMTIIQSMIATNKGYLVYYISPMMFGIGMLSNLFLLGSVLWRKLYNVSVIFVFLSFIAVTDIVSLITVNGLDLFELGGHTVSSSVACSVKFFLNYVSSKASVYILIAAYIYRLLAVLRPRQRLSIARQNKQIVIICVAIIIFMFFLDLYVIVIFLLRKELIGTIRLPHAFYNVYDCVYTKDYNRFKVIFPITYITLYVILPGFLLTCLSVAIFIVLHRWHQKHKLLTNKNQPNVNRVKNITESFQRIRKSFKKKQRKWWNRVKRRDTEEDGLPEPTNLSENKQRKTSSAQHDVYRSAKHTASILVPMSVLHIVITLPRYIVVLEYFTGRNPGSFYDVIYGYYMTSRCVSPLNYCLNLYLLLICSKFFRNAMLPFLKKLSCTKSVYSQETSFTDTASGSRQAPTFHKNPTFKNIRENDETQEEKY